MKMRCSVKCVRYLSQHMLYLLNFIIFVDHILNNCRPSVLPGGKEKLGLLILLTGGISLDGVRLGFGLIGVSDERCDS